MRRVLAAPLLVPLMIVGACKPTIIEEPEPDPPPANGAASDPPVEQRVEQEAVRAAVRAYASALSERDVEAARRSVVPETFDFYEDLRVAALRADREALERFDLMSVIMVLQIRAELSRAELEAVDGRGLFGAAVSAGLVGEDLESLNLDEVWIDEAGTQAQIRLDGDPVVWLREVDDADAGQGEGSWRVDVPEMVRLLGPAIEAMVREQVAADGKARTAYMLVESEQLLPLEILDGPLESAVDESEGEPGE